MDDAGLVREIQRIEQFAHDAHRLGNLELLLGIEEATQLAALDVFHHQVGHVALLGEVVHADDVGMVQAPGGLRLARELRGIHLRRLGVDGRVLQDGLDRHAPVERRVQAFVDHAHRATAQHLL